MYERLYDHVLTEIRSGALKGGDRVPSEKELAERFGVSRITSKRALEMLSQAGVVARIRGKGSFVVDELPSLDGIVSSPRDGDAARARTQSSSCIGLVLPDASEAYGLELLRGVEERCGEHGFYLVLKRTMDRQDEEERAIDSLVAAGAVDGLIVFPVHGDYYNSSLVRLVLDHYPLVLVDRYLKGIPACAVATDNVAAARMLTGHLARHGHEQIAFASPPPEHTSSIEERLQGYSFALAEHGLSLHRLTDLRSTMPGCSTAKEIEKDLEAIRAFVAAQPQVTGLVASEYNVALLLWRALRGLEGWRDGRYTIVCFDSPSDPFAERTFAHIRQGQREMGHRAVDLLVAQLQQREGVPRETVFVPFELVEMDDKTY